MPRMALLSLTAAQTREPRRVAHPPCQSVSVHPPPKCLTPILSHPPFFPCRDVCGQPFLGRSLQSRRSPSRGANLLTERKEQAHQANPNPPADLQYARSSLPVLAALIVSGHITAGDVIDLPLPYPEVWDRTVAYVYTGQGDLTDAVRENILYLAGKV